MEQRNNFTRIVRRVSGIRLGISHGLWFVLALLCVLTLFTISKNSLDKEQPQIVVTPELQTVVLCMDRYGTRKQLQDVDVQLVEDVFQLCYRIISTDLLEQEQIIRNHNFLFQRSENFVLMIMVVVITVSGVVLAGLQLLASYKLAVSGKGSLSDGGHVNISWNNMALKSSVVGVVILGISFAFFLVFVLYVYTLKDERSGGAPLPSQVGQTNIGVAVPRQPSPAVVPK